MTLASVGLWIGISYSGEPPARAADVSSVRSTLHLETFVLNVGGAGPAAYLRVGIDLGLNQDARRAEELVPTAEIRDTILGVLGEADADDLLASSGKTKLKHDLLRSLQQRVPELGVQEVYLTEFLIQR